MKPIINRRGNALLKFFPLENEKTLEQTVYSPLTASLVIAEYNGNVLLVFNKYKQHWEFPGGVIETCESPRECAVRELMEESGQASQELDFAGIAKIQMKDSTITFATIYSCHLQAIQSFHANDEIGMIVFWDFSTDIGYIDEIVSYLAALVIRH